MKKPIDINSVCMDVENKEFVKITNGIEKKGVLTPTEGMVVRPFAWGAEVSVRYTYRKVNPINLQPVSKVTAECFDRLLGMCEGLI